MSSVFSLSCDKLRLLGDKRGKSVRRDFGQSFFASDIRHVTIIYGYGYFVHFFLSPLSFFEIFYCVFTPHNAFFLKKSTVTKRCLFTLVGVARLELTTSCPPDKRATNCAIPR